MVCASWIVNVPICPAFVCVCDNLVRNRPMNVKQKQ